MSPPPGIMAEVERRMSGKLILPGPLPATAARVSVALVDATLADAPAAVLSETTFTARAPLAAPITFDLALPPDRPAGRRWLVAATVTADPQGRLARGDYILGRAIEYPESGAAGPMTLSLEHID